MIKAFENTALCYPDRIAYVTDGRSISYKDLCNLAKEKANELEAGVPVVLVGDKSIEYLSYILACTMKGAPYIPVDPALPTARKDALCLAVGKCKYIDCISGEERFLDGEECLLPKDCVYVIFTSGSTGAPKGVPITKENLESFFSFINAISPLSDYNACAVMNQASFSFDLSVADLYYALGNGHTLVGASRAYRENIALWLDALKSSGAKVCVVTPTFMRMCLLSKDFSRENFPELDSVYFCGEVLGKPIVKKLWERFEDLKIINAYGPTEATSAVSATLVTREDLDSEKPLPVGDMDSLATKVEIIDGEIVLRGKSVFGGYLNVSSSACRNENGENVYRTGDCGYTENGRLYCTGRLDSQIKYAGYRIELGDIEENVRAAVGDADVAVVALRDENGSVKKLRAFVVTGEGYTPEDIRNALRERLPEYMMPQIIVTDKLPVNENSKLDVRRMSQ